MLTLTLSFPLNVLRSFKQFSGRALANKMSASKFSLDTLVCYMAFRRQVVQGSSSWQRAGALAENLAEKGA